MMSHQETREIQVSFIASFQLELFQQHPLDPSVVIKLKKTSKTFTDVTFIPFPVDDGRKEALLVSTWTYAG